MEPFFTTLARGTMWGALMGAGLGSVSGVLAMNRTERPKTLAFTHPLHGHEVELDTYDLDNEAGTVNMLRRVQHTLHIEPSVRPETMKQFAVILAKTRSFYNTLKAYVDAPDELKFKIKARKCATSASQSITNFEAYVWDSPEIEDIMGCLEVVRKAMVDKMLSLDKS
jgi:hypothetical protein